jgi:hypothetical protein
MNLNRAYQHTLNLWHPKSFAKCAVQFAWFTFHLPLMILVLPLDGKERAPPSHLQEPITNDDNHTSL